jgi:hypothetical protein
MPRQVPFFTQNSFLLRIYTRVAALQNFFLALIGEVDVLMLYGCSGERRYSVGNVIERLHLHLVITIVSIKSVCRPWELMLYDQVVVGVLQRSDSRPESA